MQGFFKTLIRPDQEEDPERTLVARAANVLQVGEFQLLQLAYHEWHGHDLPQKFRKLGLRHALSAKAKAGELVVIESAEAEGKTAALAKQVANLGWKRALVIDGATVNEGFLKASKNIEGLDILPSMGANVYDILKRDTLVLTKAAVEALEARLK